MYMPRQKGRNTSIIWRHVLENVAGKGFRCTSEACGTGTWVSWRRSVFMRGTCAANRHPMLSRGAGPYLFFGPAPQRRRTCATTRKKGGTCANPAASKAAGPSEGTGRESVMPVRSHARQRAGPAGGCYFFLVSAAAASLSAAFLVASNMTGVPIRMDA